MSFLSRVLGTEKRDGLETPSQALLDAIGSRTYSGKNVTVESSLELVGVYAAVSRVAGSIGSLPMMVYRRLDRGRERAYNHRAWKLLHDQPNAGMAADEFYELLSAHLLLWGNAFAAKIRDGLGVVSELIPLRPNRVKVGANNGERFYILDGNPSKRYTSEDILHIRGLGTDGLVGLSPIQQARQMLAGGMSMEEFTQRFWGNSANPGGALTHPNKLSPEAAERLRDSWRARSGGLTHSGDVVVLEEGMKFEATAMPVKDAQFIETQQFSLAQIALLFGLQPSALGAPKGDSMTYSNTEHEAIDFARWTLRRWLVRIEGALLTDPSIFVQGQRFYPEFLVDALLRADTKTRYEAYAVALNGEPFLDVDEVREFENLNPKSDQGGSSGSGNSD